MIQLRYLLVFIVSLSIKQLQAETNVFFKELFDTNPFSSNWVKSINSKYSNQAIEWSAPEFPVKGYEDDKGMFLSQSHKHYGISTKFDTPLTLKSDQKELVIQYELKFDEELQCGGAYIKLLRANPDLDLSELTNDTPYTIMFGPDKCGLTSKVS